MCKVTCITADVVANIRIDSLSDLLRAIDNQKFVDVLSQGAVNKLISWGKLPAFYANRRMTVATLRQLESQQKSNSAARRSQIATPQRVAEPAYA